MNIFKTVLDTLKAIKKGYRDFRVSCPEAVVVLGFIGYLWAFTSFVNQVDQLALDLGIIEVATEELPITMADGTSGAMSFEYMKLNNGFLYFALIIGYMLVCVGAVTLILCWDEVFDWIYDAFCYVGKMCHKGFTRISKPNKLLTGTSS